MVKLAVSNTLAIFGGSGVGGKTTTTASPKTNKGQKHPQKIFRRFAPGI